MLSDRLVNVIFTIAAVVGAFILLYVARLVMRGRVQNIAAPVQVPNIAMAPSVPMAPSAAAAPAASPAPARPAMASSDVMEQIKKLGELHAAGILTDSEFATKKAELLTRL